MAVSPFALTGQQAAAAGEVRRWFACARRGIGSPVFYLGGFAGTGKTTITHQMIAELGLKIGSDVVFASFTGKAALVMTRHGTPATTIHALCYRYAPPDEDLICYLQSEIAETAPASPRLPEARRQLANALQPRWSRNENSAAADAKLIVIDECSMVDQALARDLLAFGKPILVLGDPGQLPPINGPGYFTAGRPDVMLTEIHRQAADSPIVRLATMAREGRPIPFGTYGPDVAKNRGNADDLQWLPPAEQVITGTHVTRRAINRLMRAEQGLEDPLPTREDKVIIMRNQLQLGLVNGGFATLCSRTFDPDGLWFEASILTEDGVKIEGRQKVYAGWFLDHCDFDPGRRSRDREDLQYLVEADFGYAITVHKAQGSEWKA